MVALEARAEFHTALIRKQGSSQLALPRLPQTPQCLGKTGPMQPAWEWQEEHSHVTSIQLDLRSDTQEARLF